MILGIGSDLANIERIAAALERFGDRFRTRVFTETEIAKAEGMDVSQVHRLMRLTLLAPEVVERLVGAPDAVLEKVMRRPWPPSWENQRRMQL